MTPAGAEPVRHWLKDIVPREARHVIGADIKAVQALWPVGKPLVDSLGRGLYEVRSSHDGVEYRTLFVVEGPVIVLLHGFVKKTARAPRREIDLARARQRALESE